MNVESKCTLLVFSLLYPMMGKYTDLGDAAAIFKLYYFTLPVESKTA